MVSPEERGDMETGSMYDKSDKTIRHIMHMYPTNVSLCYEPSYEYGVKSPYYIPHRRR